VHEFSNLGRRVLTLNAGKLGIDDGSEVLVLTIKDVTSCRHAEGELKQVRAQLARAEPWRSHDLATAVKIQESLLPDKGLLIPGVDFAWFCRPCEELGGDGLNIVPLGSGSVGLYLLDVTGHGVAAALLSVSVTRLLSPPPNPPSILGIKRKVGEPIEIKPTAEVADALNQLFPFDEATEQFTSMVYGILDVASGVFRFTSAGHPGPVLFRGGFAPRILESSGLPIGLSRESYGEQNVHVEAGDRLYLYSDGLIEAMNARGEWFGEARFLEAFVGGGAEPLRKSVASLMDELGDWRGSEPAQDDISLPAIELSAPARISEPNSEHSAAWTNSDNADRLPPSWQECCLTGGESSGNY